MASLPRRMVAEALGTFGLAFIGCAAVVVNAFPGANYGLVGIALAHALVLSIMITCTMNISGGHHNPAVTIGLLSVGRINGRDAGAYIVAQLAGAVLGAFLVKVVLPAGVVASGTLGTPAVAVSISGLQAVMIEAILTFFLVSAVFGTAVADTAP